MKRLNRFRIFTFFVFTLILITVPAFAYEVGDTVRFYCMVCGGWQEYIVSSVVSSPTCISQGVYRVECPGCGNSSNSSLGGPLGHDWTETSREDATCTTSGAIYYGCSRCAETKTETIPQLATDHTWTETSRTAATCTTAGTVNYT